MRKNNRRMRKIITITLIMLAFLSGWGQNVGTSIDGIVAVIGKSIIMRSDLEKHFIDYKAQFKTVEDPDEVYCSILENLIFNKLMVNQAELDSIDVTDEEVDYRLNTRIQYFLQQTGGDVKYIENYFNKSMAEIKKDMREMMYEQALIEQVQSSITSNITVTPSEVNQFAAKIGPDSMPMVETSYQFGEIVKIPPVSDEEVAAVKERLNSYRERILRGEKIGALARLYSDDPGSASKGGDLGFVERGTLYPEFEAAAFNLKSGEVSQIVKTQAGYHIIQMIERRGESIRVAHILIQPKPSTDEQVRAITYLDSVRQIILDEKLTLEQAAKRFSEGSTKMNGGMVVNPYNSSLSFDRQTLDDATYATINKLIPGEYSECVPFVNDDGVMAYRLIYLKEKVSQHKANLVEDYDMIKNAALEQKKYEAMEKWVVDKVKVTNMKISEQYKYCPFVSKWQIP
ncbi:MAG: peptidylprolyl isomerase [Bacteroidales bacterium]|nr:peptidylprolyl isomerase [Bacteroidales bacterium]